MEEWGKTGFSNYSEGVEAKKETVVKASREVMDAAVKEINSYNDAWYEAGFNIPEGIAKGASDRSAERRACNNIADVVLEMKKQVMKTSDSHSPSRVFAKIGSYFILGLAKGVKDNVRVATQATKDAGEASILSMRETIKKLSLEASNNIDTNPRITPVLDLTNVTDGINTMNGMFNTTRAYRLASMTSTEAGRAVSRKATAYYQNGSTFDDSNVNASIDSLRGELAGLKDSINGMQVVMDGRALVGQIVTPMDKALGKKVSAGRRHI